MIVTLAVDGKSYRHRILIRLLVGTLVQHNGERTVIYFVAVQRGLLRGLLCIHFPKKSRGISAGVYREF